MQHKPIRMNPKAIRAEEMFGETNKASGEWVDGVFAAMWSKFNDRNRKDMQVGVRKVLHEVQHNKKRAMSKPFENKRQLQYNQQVTLPA